MMATRVFAFKHALTKQSFDVIIIIMVAIVFSGLDALASFDVNRLACVDSD
jgi:hypothetical protein